MKQESTNANFVLPPRVRPAFCPFFALNSATKRGSFLKSKIETLLTLPGAHSSPYSIQNLKSSETSICLSAINEHYT